MKKWQKQLTALMLSLAVSMSFSLSAAALDWGSLKEDLKDLVGDYLGESGSGEEESSNDETYSREEAPDDEETSEKEESADKQPADDQNVKWDGWVQQGSKWFYYRNGTPVSGWFQQDNMWFYLKDTGEITTGWIQQGNSWYYLKPSGVMATGWVQQGNNWYYLKPSGAMATGWIQQGNSWYYLKPSGIMATGWLQQGNSWYYLKPSGIMATGWLQLGKNWYYLKPSGVMATGTLAIDGRNYTFRSNGIWTGTSTAITGLQGKLDSIALNPKTTGSERLNKLVQEFIRKNLSDDMDTYTKVKTTFDYMINNYTYKREVIDVTGDEELRHLYGHHGITEIMAIWILERETGVCDNYSAAFAAIMQAIGLDCRVVNGIAYTTSGSGSGHAWTVIDIGGTEYIFDPQIEQNIAQRDGKVHYYRFGLPVSSMAGKYSPSSYSDFNYVP